MRTLEEILKEEQLEFLAGHVVLEENKDEYRLYPTTEFGRNKLGEEEYLGFSK